METISFVFWNVKQPKDKQELSERFNWLLAAAAKAPDIVLLAEVGSQELMLASQAVGDYILAGHYLPPNGKCRLAVYRKNTFPETGLHIYKLNEDALGRYRLMAIDVFAKIRVYLLHFRSKSGFDSLAQTAAAIEVKNIIEFSPPYTNPKVERIRRGRGVRTARY